MVKLCADGRAHNHNPCANSIAVALCAPERNLQPVASSGATVHPDFCRLSKRCDDRVDPSVAVEVAKSTSPMAGWGIGCKARLRGKGLPFRRCPHIAKNRVVFVHL